MKVLLFNGSMKEKGCTYTALNIIKEELESLGIAGEIFQIGHKPVRGCNGCGSCYSLKKCIYGDDGVNRAIELLGEVDAVIVGSPVHYAGASGSVTSFLDRLFFAAKSQGLFTHKPGAAIVSCRRGGATAAFDQLNKYFTISQMPIISSTYWNMVHGNTPEEVMQDLEGIHTMKTLARNMAYQLKVQEAGKAAGINPPEPLPKVSTNFIR